MNASIDGIGEELEGICASNAPMSPFSSHPANEFPENRRLSGLQGHPSQSVFTRSFIDAKCTHGLTAARRYCLEDHCNRKGPVDKIQIVEQEQCIILGQRNVNLSKEILAKIMRPSNQMKYGIPVLVASAVLAGCASAPSVPLPPEVSALEHQFILEKDDRTLRQGANPTYALLERRSDNTYKVVAFSTSFIPFTRNRQEELFITQGFTNVVPAWDDFSVTYKEDPKTGKRTNYVFTSNTAENSDRKQNYGPGNSSFSYLLGTQAMPTLAGWGQLHSYGLSTSEVRRAVAQAHVLEEAKAWKAGTKQYPNTGPTVEPLVLPPQVWLVETRAGGEKGRFYFVPTRLKTRFDDYVDANSTLYVARIPGLASEVPTPLADIKRFKVYRTSPPTSVTSNMGCAGMIMDIGNETNLDQRFCSYNHDGQWSLPVQAKSPTLGNIKVWAAEGQAYDLKGKPTNQRSLTLSFYGTYGLAEYRVLTASEAARVKATFQ